MNKLFACCGLVPGIILLALMLPVILIAICLQKFCFWYLIGAEIQLFFVYWCFDTLRGKTKLTVDEYAWENYCE